MEVIEVDFGKPSVRSTPLIRPDWFEKAWKEAQKQVKVGCCPHCGTTEQIAVVCECPTFKCGNNAYLQPDFCRTAVGQCREAVFATYPDVIA